MLSPKLTAYSFLRIMPRTGLAWTDFLKKNTTYCGEIT